jgi:uncharacterized UPF0160 family protein
MMTAIYELELPQKLFESMQSDDVRIMLFYRLQYSQMKCHTAAIVPFLLHTSLQARTAASAWVSSSARAATSFGHVARHHSLPQAKRTYSSVTMSALLVFKRAKLDESSISAKVIGTHSGTFQADEAMGVWMLRQLPIYRNSKVVRSRDPSALVDLDIVIDVGGEYNHSNLRYDHHQRGYDERFEKKKGSDEIRCTKLSASGLVYRHYGMDLLKVYYPDLQDDYLELAYHKIYNSLLQALDAIDTGVELAPDGVELAYRDATGLSSRVGRLNPRWNEIDSDGNTPSLDDRFEEAVRICGDDFLSVMTVVVESDIPARSLVENALLKRHETDESGEIIALESGGLPWRGHLYELEKEHSVDPLVKFVLYTDVSGMWRVQAVTVEGKAFENRLSLPEGWRGVRDQDLAALTQIPGTRFVHAAGFIGGADTYDGKLDDRRRLCFFPGHIP